MRTPISKAWFDHAATVSDQEYLHGLRGFLVIQCFLWTFLQTFVPAAVKGSQNVDGPGYQVAFRKTLSILFWNDSLIYSFFVVLSARTVCIPFLTNSTRTVLAGASFGRGLRLWFPVAVILAIISITFSSLGVSYIDDFKRLSGNESFSTPYQLPNALAYFNSVFNVFWIPHSFATQAASYAFPSETLWIISLLFSQSYTVYMTMVMVPYTTYEWRIQAYLVFILTAWWVQSWAWYTATGLLLADAVMNMDYKARSKRGARVWRNIRCPYWIPATVLVLAGLAMQYLWVAWRPQDANAELVAHASLYSSGQLNQSYDLSQPQARNDIYLIVLGFFLLLESFDFLQAAFQMRVLVFLGRRSLSYFLVQGWIMYSAGIKLWLHLHNAGSCSDGVAVFACFTVSLAVVPVTAEVFHRLVENPAHFFAHWLFDWIRK